MDALELNRIPPRVKIGNNFFSNKKFFWVVEQIITESFKICRESQLNKGFAFFVAETSEKSKKFKLDPTVSTFRF
jgi:hypothetical protein